MNHHRTKNFDPRVHFSTRPMGGMTLVEVLLALSITAVLMLAIVIALRAGIQTINVNQDTLASRSRIALNRMLDQIRTAQAHAPYISNVTAYTTGYIKTGKEYTNIGVKLIDPRDNADYVYYLDAGQIKVTRNGSAPVSLLDGVTAFQVTLWPGKSPASRASGGDYDQTRLVTITLSASGNESGKPVAIAVSGSSVPRINSWSGSQLSYPIDTIIAENRY